MVLIHAGENSILLMPVPPLIQVVEIYGVTLDVQTLIMTHAEVSTAHVLYWEKQMSPYPTLDGTGQRAI